MCCPQMISIYRWKGSVEQDKEHQIVIKTTADRLATLEARLRQLHPYELPEFLVIDPAGGGLCLHGVGEGVGHVVSRFASTCTFRETRSTPNSQSPTPNLLLGVGGWNWELIRVP